MTRNLQVEYSRLTETGQENQSQWLSQKATIILNCISKRLNVGVAVANLLRDAK